MSNLESYDVLIVGSGKAGKTLAGDLGRSGHNVALVERGMIGGTCINVGCIPTKALVKSAKVAELVARASEFGIHVDGWKANMPQVLAYKRAVVSSMVDVNWNNLHGALGDRFIFGQANFVAPQTIEVKPNDGGPVRRLFGNKLFINLGAQAAVPADFAKVNPLTSQSALELDHLPEHLIIIGGGYIGVELGQVFRRFGSHVTIIQRGSHLLPAEDADMSEAIETIFREDGIDLLLDTQVLTAEGDSGKLVQLRLKRNDEEFTLAGTHLLVAAGRTPMTQGVGLESAGIKLDGHGFIVVNDRLETTAANTWALGDCAGSPQQTHVALDDYRIVKANVFSGGNRNTRDRLLPHTVFIDPELGRIGLTEREARRQNLQIKIAKVSASVIPRAQTLGETRGFLKAVIDVKSNQILGFAMLGAEAGEVASSVQMAMLGKLPFTALRDGILAHPTMTEGLNYLFGAVKAAT